MSDLKSLMESRNKDLVDLLPKPEPKVFETPSWKFEVCVKDRTFRIQLDQKSLRWIVLEEVSSVYHQELHTHGTLGEALHALSMIVVGLENDKYVGLK